MYLYIFNAHIPPPLCLKCHLDDTSKNIRIESWQTWRKIAILQMIGFGANNNCDTFIVLAGKFKGQIWSKASKWLWGWRCLVIRAPWAFPGLHLRRAGYSIVSDHSEFLPDCKRLSWGLPSSQDPHQVTFKQLAYYGCKPAFTKPGGWALAVRFQVGSLTMPPVPSAPLFTSWIVMTRHHLFTFFNYTTVGVSWTRPRRLFAWSPVRSVLHIAPYLV